MLSPFSIAPLSPSLIGSCTKLLNHHRVHTVNHIKSYTRRASTSDDSFKISANLQGPTYSFMPYRYKRIYMIPGHRYSTSNHPKPYIYTPIPSRRSWFIITRRTGTFASSVVPRQRIPNGSGRQSESYVLRHRFIRYTYIYISFFCIPGLIYSKEKIKIKTK